MESVMLRIVTASGRLRTVVAMFQLERTEEHVVLAIPVGSPGFTRHGATGGPRGSFLLPDQWDPGLHPRPWRHRDMVMVHRFCDEWSTWRWLDEDRAWAPGAYINLERFWTFGEGWYATDDLTLDVVIGGDGTIRFKDEDELAWAEHEQIYTAAEAAHIRWVGRRAVEHFRADAWPLHADWDRWRWPSTIALPELPDGWEHESSPWGDRRPAPNAAS